MSFPPLVGLCFLLVTVNGFGRNVFSTSPQTKDEQGKNTKRDGKLFSLFNVVTFQNEACTSTTSNVAGTCFTSQECRSNSGTAMGNCASGFGVCCVFTLQTCGGTVRQNCTYIQSEGFPTGSNELRTCTFTFARICPDLCNIRLDFDNVVLSGPDANTGSCTNDQLVATSPTGASPPSNVCGTLTGQHMYLDPGTTGNAGTLAITTGTTVNLRMFNIKVSYIECSNLMAAPSGCVQYFTGTAGNMMSYNFQGNQQLTDQNFGLCLRQEEGFCSFQLAQSSETSPDPFQLRDGALANNVNPVAAELDACTTNFITFPSTSTSDLFCGDLLAMNEVLLASAVTSQRITPFVINYFSDLDLGVPTAEVTTGFNIDYNQIPC